MHMFNVFEIWAFIPPASYFIIIFSRYRKTCLNKTWSFLFYVDIEHPFIWQLIFL